MGGCAGAEQKPPVKNQQPGDATIPKPLNSDAAKVTEPTKSSPANPPA